MELHRIPLCASFPVFHTSVRVLHVYEVSSSYRMQHYRQLEKILSRMSYYSKPP